MPPARRRRAPPPAAADAAALLAPGYATTGRPGTPRLLNRRLRVNPFTTLADEAAAAGGALDVWLSAAVDRHRWAPAAAAAAGAALGLVGGRGGAAAGAECGGG
jgi:hypothetical protein